MVKRKTKIIYREREETDPEILELRKKIQKVKLTKELDAITPQKNPEPKTEAGRIRREIDDLEKKRSVAPKGFKGFFVKAGLNREINERKAAIRQEQALPMLQNKAKAAKVALEIQKTKRELRDLQEQNSITYDKLHGFGGSKKNVKFDDLF